MRGELRRRVLGVDDFDNIAARGLDRAAVTHLAAGFAVKRRLGGQNFDFLSFNGLLFARRRCRKSPAPSIRLPNDRSR